MALMYSDDVKSLPLTTTKRGLDGSSSVYAKFLDIMRQATKRLTSFTNDYKTEEARRELLSEAPPRSLAELRSYDDLRLVDSGRLKGMKVLTPRASQTDSDQANSSNIFQRRAIGNRCYPCILRGRLAKQQ